MTARRVNRADVLEVLEQVFGDKPHLAEESFWECPACPDPAHRACLDATRAEGHVPLECENQPKCHAPAAGHGCRGHLASRPLPADKGLRLSDLADVLDPLPARCLEADVVRALAAELDRRRLPLPSWRDLYAELASAWLARWPDLVPEPDSASTGLHLVQTGPGRVCLYCGRPIAETRMRTARYCNSTCRYADRARRRL